MNVSAEPPEGLVRAQRIAIAGAEMAAKKAMPGMTERELARLAEWHARTLGARDFWSPTTVGFGAGSLRCFPTEHPTDRELWNVDVGHVDVHPVTADGWFGDCTRSLAQGSHPPHQEMLAEMEEVHRLILESARPGMPANELYEIFSQQCGRYGVIALDRLGNIGHSIGRGTSYDLGYIDSANTTPMWEAWAVEPFFGNHLYGVKLEDVLWFGAERSMVIS
jgi:Xaa-Pro dipeptidase